MADQIRMSPSEMRNRASEYSRQAENVQTVIQNMDRLLTQLQSEWEGQASRSYAEKYNSLRPGFVKAQELIEEISAALTKTANLTEQLDKDIASQFAQ